MKPDSLTEPLFGTSDVQISDEELTDLALSMDPDTTLDEDATAWDPWNDSHGTALPDWYMPRAIGVRGGHGARVLVLSLIAGFLIVDAFGLCLTSGFISLA
jgi:hypothetical protein